MRELVKTGPGGFRIALPGDGVCLHQAERRLTMECKTKPLLRAQIVSSRCTLTEVGDLAVCLIETTLCRASRATYIRQGVLDLFVCSI